MVKRVLENLDELRGFAKEVADRVLDMKGGKVAVVLALEGDLGAGKTAFAQAFAKELGIKERILSPTFLIFRKYVVPERSRRTTNNKASLRRAQGISFRFFCHADVYRIKDIKEMEVLNFKEILGNPQNMVLIEWADKIKNLMPKDAIWLKFSHGKHESERIVEFIN